MKSAIAKHSIVINGHKTSVSLEQPFWEGLKQIAQAKDVTLSSEVAVIDSDRERGSLSWAIRVFVLSRFSAGYVGRGGQTSPSESTASTGGSRHSQYN